jgi:hypothetical protein
MILTESQQQKLTIAGYENYSSNTLGLDSREHCYSEKHFDNFKFPITYQFNSIGYRERPLEEYNKNSVIVIGDSFTLGLGLPHFLTYPAQLEKIINLPVLNFSLNGASNDWIARKLNIIFNYFTPLAVFVHYTFSHRRESNNIDWADDERILSDPTTQDALHDEIDNYKNWSENHIKIKSLIGDLPSAYSFIPNWHTATIDFKDSLVYVPVVDLARDYFHYGEITCFNYAQKYAEYIK